MNMSKSRDIKAKMHLNDKNSQSVILSFKCILARNCEGTEQLQYILSLTLTRCSRKNQNWSTGPINDMQCKKSHSKNN